MDESQEKQPRKRARGSLADTVTQLTDTLQVAAEAMKAPISLPFEMTPATPQRRKSAVQLVWTLTDLSEEEKLGALNLIAADKGFVDVFVALPESSSIHTTFLRAKLSSQ